MTTASWLTPDVHGFIQCFVDEIADGNAAIFAGAGLSAGSGHVNWAELLRDIAKELGLDVDREANLVAVAQYHYNARGTRSRINQKLIDEFSIGHRPNINHEILARLPISTYWTTNYDKLIENQLEKEGKIVDVKHCAEHLKNSVRGRNAVIFKMHGDVSDADNAVITKDDYEDYFRTREPFVTALAGDLTSKTLLFLGFSFTDPNIDYIMSRVRVVLRKKTKLHYCILRKEAKRPKEKISSYRYRQLQQQYFIRDLSRIGVQAILVEDYKQITEILQLIEKKYRERTIFISGSAHSFQPIEADHASLLIEGISKSLIQETLGVVTGFGLGVGPSVIAGALQVILTNPRRYRESQIEAKPFPLGEHNRQLYREHRISMMKKCGIAIFLFGNKRDSHGNIVEADGVLEEYQIAQELGLKIIPVGCTGWVAQKIWVDEQPKYAKSPRAVKKAFAELGRPTASRQVIVSNILAIVRCMRT